MPEGKSGFRRARFSININPSAEAQTTTIGQSSEGVLEYRTIKISMPASAKNRPMKSPLMKAGFVKFWLRGRFLSEVISASRLLGERLLFRQA
jgi:hypothetical protein